MSRASLNELEVDGYKLFDVDEDNEEEYEGEESEEEGEEGESVYDEFEVFNNLDKISDDELFYKNTDSFKCLAQILVSRSSLLKHVLYHFPLLADPGIDAAFNYTEPEVTYDDIGVEKYKNICKELKVLPITRVINSLATNELNLKYYGLTGNQLRTVCETLMLNSRIKTLILQENWMDAEASYWVGEMLRENNSIQVLDLRECRVGAEGIRNMSEGFSLNLSLREIDLSHNNLEDEGVELLTKALKENQQIKVLNLGYNNLAEGAGKCLGSFISENTSMEVLDLSWNDLYTKSGLIHLCKGLILNSSLKQLNLAWNGIGTKETLGPVTKYLKNTTVLEHLDLSHNRIDSDGIPMIRFAILKNESLLSINLGFNIISPEKALSLINVFTAKREEPLKLKYMDLENIFVDKAFVPVWKKVMKLGKSVRIEGILKNYTIKGPDEGRVLFNRAKYLADKPKKKKQKRDFGHFIYELPENDMDKKDFQKLIKKKKLKLIDKDLSAAIADKFKKKNGQTDLVSLKKTYLEMYPDTQPPPVKEKKVKGKKGHKKKKTSELKEPEADTQEKGIVTETIIQDEVEVNETKSKSKIPAVQSSKSFATIGKSSKNLFKFSKGSLHE